MKNNGKLWLALVLAVLMVFGATALAQDYAPNPGFENGSATEADNYGLWPGWDQGSFIGTEDVHSGSRAISVQLSETQNYALYAGVGGVLDMKAAAQLSMWVKYENITGEGFMIGLERGTASGNDNFFGSRINGSSDGWQQLVLDIPASAFDVTAWTIKVEIATGSGLLLIDDVSLIAVEGEADANADPDKAAGVVLTGVVGVNRVTTNPGFEYGQDNWGFIGGDAIVTEDTHSGARAASITLSEETAYVAWNNLSSGYSEELIFTAWVKLENVTGGVQIGLERTCNEYTYDEDGMVDGVISTHPDVFSEVLTGSTDGWQMITVQVPAAENCESVVVKVNCTTGSGTFYMDDVCVVIADPDKNYVNANGGFEKGADTDISGWALLVNGEWPGWSADALSDDAFEGKRAVKMVGETTIMQANGWGMAKFDMNGAMTVSAKVKAIGVSGEGTGIRFKIERKDIAVDESELIAITGEDWQTVTFSVPAVEGDIAELLLHVTGICGEGTILVDDVILCPVF